MWIQTKRQRLRMGRLETIHGLQTQLLLRMRPDADGGGAIYM